MKNTLKFILCLLAFTLLLAGEARAQSLTPEVVAVSGAAFSGSTLYLEWTLGEIMTETYEGGITLTQGFLQPEGAPLVGTTNLPSAGQIALFPNPATSRVSIRLPAGSEVLDLLSVAGQDTGARFGGQAGELTTDVSGLAAGVYVLRIRLTDGRLATHRLVVH